MRERQARQAAWARGQWAEFAASLWLRLTGWRILARGFRVPQGEIDLIARRGGVVAFIEVKYRRDFAAAVEAVTPRQRARITRAAQVFLSRRPDLAKFGGRFDMVVMRPFRFPVHLADAWRPEAPIF